MSETTMTLPEMKLPVLYKATSTSGVQSWEIWVVDLGDNIAQINRRFGMVGGAQQHLQDLVTEGKNLGRSNETTPFQQACSEAQSEWQKQKDRNCYAEDVTGAESAEKRSQAPMLAENYFDFRESVDWGNAFAQPKLDGFRCKAARDGDKIVLMSRQGKQIYTMPHIEDALRAILPHGVVYDGELYRHGIPFQQISSHIRKWQEQSSLICYHVYDACSVVDSYAFRSRILDASLRQGAGPVRRVQTVPVSTEEELLRLQEEWITHGYEGAMLRHGLTPYEPNKRSQSLLKVKKFQDAEFTVIGVKEGSRGFVGMAVFVCATPEANTFDVLAPGTHEEKRAYWTFRNHYVGRQLTVKFQGFTTGKKRVPRFPIGLRFYEEAVG